MPILSDEEKNKVRELEILKKEIRETLEAGSSKESKFSKVINSQASLLLLGFVFTTLAGSALTYVWTSLQARHEHSRIERQRTFDLRSAIIERMFKEVSETNTAAEDVLRVYEWGNWKPAEVKEGRKNWLTKSREWRVASKVLEQELAANFSSKLILDKFVKIEDKRSQLGNILTNMLTGEDSGKEIVEDKEKAKQLIKDMSILLRENGATMVAEAKEELRKSD